MCIAMGFLDSCVLFMFIMMAGSVLLAKAIFKSDTAKTVAGKAAGSIIHNVIKGLGGK